MTSSTHIENSHVAVVMGRWQMPHHGHNSLFRAALDNFNKVIIIIGSAFHARDTMNPFTWQERQKMISASLSESDLAKVTFLPIRDFFDDNRWRNDILKKVGGIAGHRKITLVGHKKDKTSYYLSDFPEWSSLDVPKTYDIHATSLRNVLFQATAAKAAIAVLSEYVNAATLDYLQAWSLLPEYAERAAEHIAVEEYKKKWPSVSLTADAVIVCDGHILLQRRGSRFGKGLWALPGGFVDPGEISYKAAVRETDEETGFVVLPSTMRDALKGVKTFNHPRRSARGRLSTDAHYFEFGNMRLPEVYPKDGEAIEVKWWKIEDLPSIREKLFEDHGNIIESFLGDVFKFE